MNSYALENNAMFGGVFDCENTNSIAMIKDSVFERNYAYSRVTNVGGGGVLMQKGDYTTYISTNNNLYFDSGISIKGYKN